MSDSYKAGHFLMYPAAKSMVAYGEFREPMKGMNDNRLVFYGIRHYIDNFVSRKWTMAEVDAADAFYKTHNAGGTPYLFPRDLFVKFITENNGYFPVTIETLPEGSVIYTHTPVFIITAENEYSRLCTFLETILTMVWYPSCVATLSRYTKDVIKLAFDKSVDDNFKFLLDSRLHDFGFRGCTCVEQSVLGGAAHLLNFDGSDTMSAAYHVQYHLNGGKPVGSSIPATEHSVMTSWPNEEEAMRNEIHHYGDGVMACVMDSYDYDNALDKVLPKVADALKAKSGTIVLRPDSGDPVEQVIKGLKAADKVFGHVVNGKGFKVINKAAVIQGDGIDYAVVAKILEAVLKENYSAQNVAFGMGGGLLQKVNRDTMSFATKLCHIVYEDGRERDVMKTPKTDSGKISLPGKLAVVRKTRTTEGKTEAYGPFEVYPLEEKPTEGYENALKVVYDKGPIRGAFPDDFSAVRERLNKQWEEVPAKGDAISQQLKAKCQRVIDRNRQEQPTAAAK